MLNDLILPDALLGNEFVDCPAKIFTSAAKATAFTSQLMELQISFMTRIVMPPKRLGLPMQTIVVLLGTEEGIKH